MPDLEPTFTEHALVRFKERFPELDIRQEWSTAIRKSGLSKEIWKKLRERCVVNGPIYMQQYQLFQGVYYKLSANGVVFVIRPPFEVVTVMRAPETKPKYPMAGWVRVPGTEYAAIHCGKLPSKQFKRILKAGNEMYTVLAQTHPELAAEWIASIQPVDKYVHTCQPNGQDISPTPSDTCSPLPPDEGF